MKSDVQPQEAPLQEAKPRSEVLAPDALANLVDQLYFGTAEKTVQESPYHGDSQRKPYNPDDLYQKANDYSIYEDMLNDDQVDVCMTIKRDLILGAGWYFETEDTSEQHEAIKKDLEIAFGEDLEVSLEEQLQELLTAYWAGFSLTEKIFRTRPDGSLTLKCLKTRHPSTWLIHTDKHGNVERFEQRGKDGSIDVKPKSLIHYVNNRSFQNPYGRSDLRAAYNAWFVKRQIIKYYAIFLEKAKSPMPVAKYDKNVPQSTVDAIHNAIQKFQAKTALTIPKEIEIDFLESKSDGEAYTKGIHIFNMFIGRCLFVPDLLGFQGDETGGGSYALGKDQFAVMFKHHHRRRSILERIVNRELVWPIVVHNHGFVENFPKWKLKPVSDEVVTELAKTWLEAVKGKVFKPNDEEVNHFRSIVKFPEGDVQHPEPPPALGPDGKPVEGPENDDQDKAGDGKPGKVDPKGVEKSVPEGDAETDKKEEKQFSAKAYKACPGGYDKKCDYTAISTSMDRFKDQVLTETAPIVKQIFEDIYDQIEQRKIIRNQSPEKIDTLKVKNLKPLRLVLKRQLREAFSDGKAMAQKELLKGAQYRSPVPDDKFLEFLEAETFQYIGDWEYKVRQKARVAILEAIKDGKPLSSVIDIMDEEGMLDSMNSIERWSRTKFTEVMNRGRKAFFNDSGVVAAYQYSAILDDRTSEICAGLHGKIFKAGTEPVPPMHWNCRSLLVPITKYEDFEADDEVGGMAISDFISEHKGDGFSKN